MDDLNNRPKVFPEGVGMTQEQINIANGLPKDAVPVDSENNPSELEQLRLENERLKKLIKRGHIGVDKDEVSEPKEKPKVVDVGFDDNYDKLLVVDKDVPYDVIPLPSNGKVYKGFKEFETGVIKVAYMTTMDETIITNPNLLMSGKFMEVLFNRKMMDTELKYSDLHIGDRNAIMLWLRSTAYGSDYEITLEDPETKKPFDTVVDLSSLTINKLEIDPDEDGLFTYNFAKGSRNKVCKFRLLTMTDIDVIEKYKEDNKGKNIFESELNVFILMRHIVSIDTITEYSELYDAVKRLRLIDVRGLREEINKIEPGVDMIVDLVTPGGESVSTFLPIGLQFFWPDYDV